MVYLIHIFNSMNSHSILYEYMKIIQMVKQKYIADLYKSQSTQL